MVVYSQKQYMQKNRKVYLPKLNDMSEDVNEILEEAKQNLSGDSDSYRKSRYKINIEQNRLTINTIDKHRDILNDQYNKVETANKNSMKDLLLAHNIYETATASMDAMELIQNTGKEFNAIMEMQVPEIVPFENDEMKEIFYNMTKNVRASL